MWKKNFEIIIKWNVLKFWKRRFLSNIWIPLDFWGMFYLCHQPSQHCQSLLDLTDSLHDTLYPLTGLPANNTCCLSAYSKCFQSAHSYTKLWVGDITVLQRCRFSGWLFLYYINHSQQLSTHFQTFIQLWNAYLYTLLRTSSKSSTIAAFTWSFCESIPFCCVTRISTVNIVPSAATCGVYRVLLPWFWHLPKVFQRTHQLSYC